MYELRSNRNLVAIAPSSPHKEQGLSSLPSRTFGIVYLVTSMAWALYLIEI